VCGRRRRGNGNEKGEDRRESSQRVRPYKGSAALAERRRRDGYATTGALAVTVTVVTRVAVLTLLTLLAVLTLVALVGVAVIVVIGVR